MERNNKQTLVRGLTDAELEARLCNPTQLQQLVQLPSLIPISAASLSGELCRQLRASPSDRARILSAVRAAIAPNLLQLDFSSWLQLIGNFSNLFTELQNLQQLQEIVSSFDIRKLPQYEQTLLTLIRSFPGERVQRVGYALVRDLRKLSNDRMWQLLMSDLDLLFRSMRFFELTKPLFPIKLQVRDYVENVTAVREYLIQQGMQPAISDIILDSYLSTEQLFNLSLKLNLPAALCDVEKLKELVSFNNVSYNASLLVEQMCQNATLKDVENTTETIIRMGNFGQLFTKNLASNLLDKLLNESGVSRADISDVINIVNSVGPQISSVVEQLSGISDSTNIAPNAGLTTTEALNNISTSVCGLPGKFNITAVYGVQVSQQASGSSSSSSSNSSSSSSSANGAIRKKRSTATTENTYYELGQLANNEFCVSAYKLSLGSVAGRVGWTYVKPLIRGRVIVQPDTAMTRRLMQGVEQQFQQLQSLNDIIGSLNEVLPSLSAGSGVSSLSTLLNNQLVRTALNSLLGGGTNVDSLQSIVTLLGNASSNSSSTQVMQLVGNLTSCIETNRIDYASPEGFQSAVDNVLKENRLLAAVTFSNLPTRSRRAVSNSSNLPKHVKYSIRMPYGSLYRTDALTNYPEIRISRDNFIFDLAYQRGFVQLQEAIDSAITEIHTGSPLPPQTSQQIPAPCLQVDSMLISFGFSGLPLCTVLMWLAPLVVAVQRLMYDRERRLEVPLFLMGLRPMVHFLQWLLFSMIVYLLISAAYTLIAYFGRLMPGTDPSLMFVLLTILSFSTLGFGFMVSSVLTRSSVACALCLMLYLLCFVPYIFLGFLPRASVHVVRAMHIFVPTAFSLALRGLVTLELTRPSVTWSLLSQEAFGVPVFWSFIALALDGVFCFLVGWYVRNVFPGQNGIPQGWLFFMSRRFWGCDSGAANTEAEQGEEAVVAELTGVSKKFGRKVAVQDLNLRLKAGENTILLGPNGAGKSTTINMMTGLLGSDKGKVLVNGLDVSTQFYRLRSSIGFCPQYDVCYEDLSVKANIEYFATLKNCSKKDANSMLCKIGLEKLSKMIVRNLSGGQRRRLSIGIAYLGQPKLVILDEPTASVDPEARRKIWEIIQSQRRSTLICTHDMQEAEVLGDRIAVMVNGMILENQSFDDIAAKCRYSLLIESNEPASLVNQLQNTDFPLSEVSGNRVQKSVSANLPHDGGVMAKVTYWLYGLSNFVTSFTVHSSTVMDFFNQVISSRGENQNQQMVERDYTAYSGNPNFCKSAAALLLKRMHHTRRSLLTYIGMILMPVLLVILAMCASLLRPEFNSKSDPILLTPTNYGPNAVSFLHMEASVEPSMQSAVRNTLAAAPGLGTVCMPQMQDQLLYYTPACSSSSASWYSPRVSAADAVKYAAYRNCTCNARGQYSCADKYSTGYPPSVLHSVTGDIVHQYNSSAIADFTEFLLRSESNFSLSDKRASPTAPAEGQRWGGMQIGVNGTTIWFNNHGFHTLPAYLNAFANTMLRSMIAANGSMAAAAEFGISTYNHPLAMQRSQLSLEAFDTAVMDGGLAMCIVFAMCFIPAAIAATVTVEKVTKQRRQMQLYGLSNLVYWLTSYLWDFIVYLIPMGLTIGIMAAFQINLYTAQLNLPAIAMLLALFGAASLPFAYLISRPMRSSSAAFIITFFLLFLTGILMLFIVILFKTFFTFEGKETVAQVLTYIFMVLPSFSLGSGIFEIIVNQWRSSVLIGYGANVYVNPFSMQMVAPHAIALGLACIFYWLIHLLCERSCQRKPKIRNSYFTDRSYEFGVQEVYDNVTTGACSNDPIVLEEVSKKFKPAGGFEVQALEAVTFSVGRGVCLGLLGPNGSGKSTLFNILTKKITDHEGRVSVESIGYCPQYEALDPELTVSETLNFYAGLRGLERGEAKRQIKQLIDSLSLKADVVAKRLSGGQRRKLSVAIAFLGKPRSILLDEPSAGLDSNSRETLRRLVRAAVAQGASVIMSSHCLQEVNDISDRVAILIGGRLRAIGKQHELQRYLGSGHTLTVRCSYNDLRRLLDLISKYLPTAECRLTAANVVEYAIPMAAKLNDVFNAMERIAESLSITYSLNSTTLEQIFLELCHRQGDNWHNSDISSSSDSPYSSTLGSAYLLTNNKTKRMAGADNPGELLTFKQGKNGASNLAYSNDDKQYPYI